MKHAFLITGGNCAGKTTTVAQVLATFAEDSRIESIRADNDGRFKGESSDQEAALTQIWEGPTPVLVIEGTRINTPLMRVAKKLPSERKFTVIMVIQKPDVMKAHLIARCAKRNKTFRADYWTLQKLEYEGMKRYPNSFRKNYIKPVTFYMDLEYKITDEIVVFLQTQITEALAES